MLLAYIGLLCCADGVTARGTADAYRRREHRPATAGFRFRRIVNMTVLRGEAILPLTQRPLSTSSLVTRRKLSSIIIVYYAIRQPHRQTYRYIDILYYRHTVNSFWAHTALLRFLHHKSRSTTNPQHLDTWFGAINTTTPKQIEIMEFEPHRADFIASNDIVICFRTEKQG